MPDSVATGFFKRNSPYKTVSELGMLIHSLLEIQDYNNTLTNQLKTYYYDHEDRIAALEEANT